MMDFLCLWNMLVYDCSIRAVICTLQMRHCTGCISEPVWQFYAVYVVLQILCWPHQFELNEINPVTELYVCGSPDSSTCLCLLLSVSLFCGNEVFFPLLMCVLWNWQDKQPYPGLRTNTAAWIIHFDAPFCAVQEEWYLWPVEISLNCGRLTSVLYLLLREH